MPFFLHLLKKYIPVQRLHEIIASSVIPIAIVLFLFGNAQWMVCVAKTTITSKSINKIERKAYIYSFFGTWWFWFHNSTVHNGLTSIPWWLPTYFSLLLAMNFNETLPYHWICVMRCFGFHIVCSRVPPTKSFCSRSHVCVCAHVLLIAVEKNSDEERKKQWN